MISKLIISEFYCVYVSTYLFSFAFLEVSWREGVYIALPLNLLLQCWDSSKTLEYMSPSLDKKDDPVLVHWYIL